MQPETRKFLHDIHDAADRITDYAQSKSCDDYLADNKLRDAVQWNFAVIGEALGQLEKTDPDVAHQITEWRRIIAFRNQLIHGYGVIRHQITWDIIQNKLPVLRSDVEALLANP
jgi:uncharacterized protein with HEPN domain